MKIKRFFAATLFTLLALFQCIPIALADSSSPLLSDAIVIDIIEDYYEEQGVKMINSGQPTTKGTTCCGAMNVSIVSHVQHMPSPNSSLCMYVVYWTARECLSCGTEWELLEYHVEHGCGMFH